LDDFAHDDHRAQTALGLIVGGWSFPAESDHEARLLPLSFKQVAVARRFLSWPPAHLQLETYNSKPETPACVARK